MALDEDPEQQVVAEPETQDTPPKVGMAAHNARNRKQPKKYVSRMQGNKYQVALLQIGASKMLMAFAQKSVKKALETVAPCPDCSSWRNWIGGPCAWQ